ncbi:MAG: ribonuclease J [Patescibacteria group bacterium]
MQLYNSDASKPVLKIITLSGTESVTKNLTVYECGDDIIAVDCGIGFPDVDMRGVDLVLPDFTYLKENSHKFKALFITHGHEDHIGAVPYLLQELNVPIYSSQLVLGFLTERLKERLNEKLSGISLNVFDPDSGKVRIGAFEISAFRINHSVPRSQGLAIKTSQGTILHMADYKIDWTPVLDKPIDLAKIARFGEEGVLCLLSDCLGATTEGYSKSEKTLDDTFGDLFEEKEGRQMFVTTISSNISRMHQIIVSALKHHRKVVLVGRSIDQSMRVALSLGYVNYDKDVFVSDKDASSFAQNELVYIIAGCYGQDGSALDRLARAQHDNIQLQKDAVVIFSADPSPPSVREDVERLIDTLTLAGAEVIYGAIQENLHVSGHGPRGDLTIVASVARPKYFIPIGGTVSKMRAYTNMVETLGYTEKSVFESREGESVIFENGVAKKGPKIETEIIMVGQNGEGEIHETVVKDRQRLANDGVFVVILPVSKDRKKLVGKVEAVTRGFVFVKESKELLDKSSQFATKSFSKHLEKSDDWGHLRFKMEKEIQQFLLKETGCTPLVIVYPVVV